MSRTLTLYVRVGCSLCEQLELELAPLAAELGAAVRVIDIDSDPTLVARHGARVPVLEGDQGEICHYFLDPERVREYFAAS